MVKANKVAAVAGNAGNAGKAGKASKGKAAAPVPLPVAVGNQWCGYSLCGLLRALGYAGYTASQAAALCNAVGLAASPSTVGCQVGGGRQYAQGKPQPHHTGGITPLAGAVLAAVVQAVGQPAKPHATTAPLPVKPQVGVMPPAPVAAPAATPAKATGKASKGK